MIGNDVVDMALAKAESNWKRPGYLQKIFTAGEQIMISSSLNKDSKVWDLWSRKEAAYKIYNRQTEIRSYIPLEFECFDLEIIDGDYYGKVICRGREYYTKTTITVARIDTIAVISKDDFIKVQYLAKDIIIQKNKGVPNYFDDRVIKPLSISHHGAFKSIVALL